MKVKHPARNNVILLACLIALILLSPLFSEERNLVRDLLLTAVFFSGIFSLNFSDKSFRILIVMGAATTATTWTNHFLENDIVHLIDFITTFLFLVAIVVYMIRHIARSRNVTATIIFSSINAYLLLGVLGGVLLAITDAVPQLFSGSQIPGIVFPGGSHPQFSDYVYFGFITLTTLGYGDVTPLSHLARSVAMLIAVTGQLYMTILIAMLVGKFLARSEGN